MTTEEIHARLDALTWIGFSILALSAGAMIGLIVWYWQTGRKDG